MRVDGADIICNMLLCISQHTLYTPFHTNIDLCNTKNTLQARRRKRDIFKQALRDLASLSLIDYKWRSAVFKKAEADRLEEEYLSKMMGEDYASYARPMDADDTRRGPLVSLFFACLLTLTCTCSIDI